MDSTLFDWEMILPVPTKTGTKRPFFRSPTNTLEKLAVHVSTLNPGEAAHAPHQHPEEEMIICKEGALDAFHNGQTKPMGPGSVLFLASNDLHGVRNIGGAPATYYVIKWFCHPHEPASVTGGGQP
jgi:quercetin dioxygenase-like cupin family protein